VIGLDSLHLVEDGTGELVRGGLAAHIAGADLAAWLSVTGFLQSFIVSSEHLLDKTYPSAITP
jgi:hypothetical protein